MTEPECDREFSKKTKSSQKILINDHNDGLENISGEQLQEELDKIIRDYKRKKQIEARQKNKEPSKGDEKFIISV